MHLTSVQCRLAKGRIAVLSLDPRGSECIRPPRALDRHVRPRQQANNVQCIHARYVAMGRNMSAQKYPIPMGIWHFAQFIHVPTTQTYRPRYVRHL